MIPITSWKDFFFIPYTNPTKQALFLVLHFFENDSLKFEEWFFPHDGRVGKGALQNDNVQIFKKSRNSVLKGLSPPSHWNMILNYVRSEPNFLPSFEGFSILTMEPVSSWVFAIDFGTWAPVKDHNFLTCRCMSLGKLHPLIHDTITILIL